MEETRPLQSIPDDELLGRLADLMGQSRRIEADVVAHIGEVEERRLFAREAFPSMFAYSMSVLHLSEAEAYLRIAAARASREHPILLTMLADGRLHLTAIARLAPHLTRENRDGLLERATHRSKRQVLELIAEIAPKPDAPAVMRKLPERRVPSPGLPGVLNLGVAPTLELCPDTVGEPVVPAPAPPVAPALVQPLSPGRYKVQFTASTELHDKLERLRALMGGRGQDGDLAAVIEQAVTEKLERLTHFARPNTSGKGLAKPDSSHPGRHIPAAVRRAVVKRDGGQCRYADAQGRRCPERSRLEYHHRHPFGFGGDHSLSNISLTCRAHNAFLVECDYGKKAMARHRRAQGGPSQTAADQAG